ncbi:S8 family serine peptidase [Clostridium sp. Marseille-P299]|uniref:S8 family serine peptidase n=1 Tax=Clostridium sp. Marseille-P299 TaxID=1805477 RepID=UPI00082CF1A2|nr:S8 family serine peptidase [Clostridium sp. Marseille-P299]
MLIALIDDGIDSSAYANIHVKYDMQIGNDCVVRKRQADDWIMTDHGTTCAGIISKYAPMAEFCSIRIFHDERLRSSCDQLIAAMEWCMEKQVPIIHLSVGSSQPNDFSKLRVAVAKLIQRRHIVVAAHSNSSKYSVPACLNGVLGVIADSEFEGSTYQMSTDLYAINNMIKASSRHNLRTSSGIDLVTIVANSYAAPTVTAAVHNILEQYGEFSMLVSQIYTKLLNGSTDNIFSKPDFIEDAYIINPMALPFLKEHLFFRCIAEYSNFTNMNNNCNECKSIVLLSPYDSNESEKNNTNFTDIPDSITTLLYGGRISGPFKKALSERMLIWSKENNEYANCLVDMQYEVSSVIICIHGDSVKILHTLCTLRKMFIDDGYLCRGLTDAPEYFLYDLEFISPNTSVQSAIMYLDKTYSPDVVICGFQCTGSSTEFDVEAYHILLGDCKLYDSISKGQSSLLSVIDTESLRAVYIKILSYFLE